MRPTLCGSVLFAAALSAAVLAWPSAARSAPERESKPAPQSKEDLALAQGAATGANRFGLDLYGELRKEEGNLFFSPYSISTALAMTREGAEGATAAEMDATFHFPQRLSATQEALRHALKPREVPEYGRGGRRLVPAYALATANRLWGAHDASFRKEFVDLLGARYGAPLTTLDFRDGEACREEINGWVEEHTQERIKDILTAPLPLPNTRLVLANAIYFKAGWAQEFDEHRTEEADWHLGGGKTSRAQLMGKVADYGYAEDEEVQVLEMGYRGGDTSMVVVLPKARDGLAALEAKLSSERLAGWLGGLRDQKVDVRLPRFEFTTPALNLRKHLEALGMKRAFASESAQFGGMTPSERLFVSAVVHKAFIAVDEQGTEAAAATVVMMGKESVEIPREPKRFRADHPFLFLIRHRKTGAILFLGRLSKPQ